MCIRDSYTTIITEDPKTGYECKSKLF